MGRVVADQDIQVEVEETVSTDPDSFTKHSLPETGREDLIPGIEVIQGDGTPFQLPDLEPIQSMPGSSIESNEPGVGEQEELTQNRRDDRAQGLVQEPLVSGSVQSTDQRVKQGYELLLALSDTHDAFDDLLEREPENQSLLDCHDKAYRSYKKIAGVLHSAGPRGIPDVPPDLIQELQTDMRYLAGRALNFNTSGYVQAQNNLSEFPKGLAESLEVAGHFDYKVGNLISVSKKVRQNTYETDVLSREFEKYGSVSALRGIIPVIEKAFSDSIDGREQKRALYRDAGRAVEQRLAEIDKTMELCDPDHNWTRVQASHLLVREQKGLAETLMGIDPQYNQPALRDTETAIKHARAAIQRMDLGSAVNWLEDMDTAIQQNYTELPFYARSSEHTDAHARFFAAVRAEIVSKIVHREGVLEAGPKREALQQQAYEFAVLVREMPTRIPGTKAKSMLDAHPMYRTVQAERSSSADSMQAAMSAINFDTLALDYLEHSKRVPNPLNTEIHELKQEVNGWLSSDPRAQSLSPEHKAIVQQALAREPDDMSESIELYANLRSFTYCIDTENTNPLVAQEQVEGEVNEILEPYIADARKQFQAFLMTTHDIADIARATGEKFNRVESDQIERTVDLMRDIQGAGAFDLSDASWGYVRIGGKIAVMVGSGVVVGVSTGGMGLVASAVVSGTAMTASGMMVNPEGYDYTEDAVERIGTRLSVDIASAGAGHLLGTVRSATALRAAGKSSSIASVLKRGLEPGGLRYLNNADEGLSLFSRVGLSLGEGTAAAGVDAALESSLIEGANFVEEFQRSLYLVGLTAGLEVRRSDLKFLQEASEAEIREVARLVDGVSLAEGNSHELARLRGELDNVLSQNRGNAASPEVHQRRPRATSVPAVSQAADKFGQEYHQLLESVLGASPERFEETLRSLENSLGLGYAMAVVQGLQENRTLLRQHKGSEASYLLTSLADSFQLKPEVRKQLLDQVDSVRYFEPSPGVALLEVEQEFFSEMKAAGLVNPQGGAIHFGATDSTLPSVVVVPRPGKSIGLESEEAMLSNRKLRHEVHHLLWNFARRNEGVPVIQETNQTKALGLRNFKNEFAAYVVENKFLQEIQPEEILTYSTILPGAIPADRTSLQREATLTRDHLRACMAIAHSHDLDLRQFLQPAMQAQSFSHLRNQASKLISEIPLDEHALQVLLSDYGDSSIMVGLDHYLKESGKRVTPETFLRYAALQEGQKSYRTFGDLVRPVNRLETIAGQIGTQFDGDRYLAQLMERHFALTPEDAVHIPASRGADVVLSKDRTELLTRTLDLSRPNGVEALRGLLEHSPEFRELTRKLYPGLMERSYLSATQFIRPSSLDRTYNRIDNTARELWEIVGDGDPIPEFPARL